MLTIDTCDALDLIRYVIANSLDRTEVVLAWDALRKQTKGPIFAVKPIKADDRQSRAEFRRDAVAALADAGATYMDMVRLLGLSRPTVTRYAVEWRALPAAQKTAAREARQAALRAGNAKALDVIMTKNAHMIAMRKLKDRNRQHEDLDGWQDDEAV